MQLCLQAALRLIFQFHCSKLVVFDIDETSLSNLPLIISSDFGFIPQFWYEWETELNASAINGTLLFYQLLQNLGVSTIFITGMSPFSPCSPHGTISLVGHVHVLQVEPSICGTPLNRISSFAGSRMAAADYALSRGGRRLTATVYKANHRRILAQLYESLAAFPAIRSVTAQVFGRSMISFVCLLPAD